MITYRPKSLILIISHTQSHLHTHHYQNPFYLEAKKLKRQRDRHRRFHLNPNPHPRLLPPPSSSLPPPPPPPPLPPRSEMAIEPAEKVPLILTSGASGRISALLSPRSLKSLVSVFVNALFLLLLLPFRGRKRCVSNSTHPVAPNREKLLLQPRNDSCKGASVVVPRRSPPVRDDEDVASRRALAIRSVIQDEDKDTVRDFSLFLTGRGDTMFTQSWTPVSINIRGVVVLLHGLNEHSGRYDDFAKLLNTNGYKVYGMDWIGHGGSDGLHAYVHSLDDAVADMKIFLKMVVAENPGLPCFCFGHSTGGAIVIKAALDPKVEACIAGIVITSPAIGVQPSHPIYGVIAPVVSFLLPRYQFNAANKKGAVVSRDPEALVSKYSDPLVYTGGIRVRTGYEILRISSYLQRNLGRLRIPFLVLHGSADCVTDPEFSQKLYRESSSVDKTFKLLEGLLHDLLIEPEREEIMKDIIEWLNSK